MLVKICANKSIEDAKMSIDAGADVVGILVGQEHSSPDFVDKDKAKEICDFVCGRADVSLVTHLTNAEEIISLTKYIGNNTIQLHSNIDEHEVAKIRQEMPNVKLVRLIHVNPDGTPATNYKLFLHADFYLLDSFNLATNQVGGTGISCDWAMVGALIKELDKPTFLAGGLTPENVQTAIKLAKPAGVDVNSGCKENGVKNSKKVTQFVKNAKNSIDGGVLKNDN